MSRSGLPSVNTRMPYKNIADRKAAIKRSKDKHREKIREKALAYYHANKCLCPRIKLTDEELKNRKKQQDRDYALNNPSKIKNRNAEYFQSNKAAIYAKRKLRQQSDINFRLSLNLRSRLSAAIKHGIKAGSAVKDLGCSMKDFRLHISKLFSSGMDWNNYGDWHLDHIVPLCKFDLSCREDFLAACNFSNYQPLWAKDNFRKNRFM